MQQSEVPSSNTINLFIRFRNLIAQITQTIQFHDLRNTLDNDTNIIFV